MLTYYSEVCTKKASDFYHVCPRLGALHNKKHSLLSAWMQVFMNQNTSVQSTNKSN